MAKYIVWYKLKANETEINKSSVSQEIHRKLLKTGHKLAPKSNAFIIESDNTSQEIVDWMMKLSKKHIRCFVSEINVNYQGFLPSQYWDLIDK